MSDLLGEQSGLFLDLAVCSILTRNSAVKAYGDYAWSHPLFARDPVPCSREDAARFLQELPATLGAQFLKCWNQQREPETRIYISYDSIGKHSQAGDIAFTREEPEAQTRANSVLNYLVAYDKTNGLPLFYELHPDSNVDVRQFQADLETAASYGYRHIGFIMDRGYFSSENIRYMDRARYPIVIMMNGMKDLVSDLVLECRGTFEEKIQNRIGNYHVSGTTVTRKLFPEDRIPRYFHIFFSDRRRAEERRKIEDNVFRCMDVLREREGEQGYRCPEEYLHYFNPIYEGEGDSQIFVHGEKRDSVIDEEIRLSGYFVIITSDKMTAEEALRLYKGRDVFKDLVSSHWSPGTRQNSEPDPAAVSNAMFLDFVALILRTIFFSLLKDQMGKLKKHRGNISVPTALKQLDLITASRQPDGNYRLKNPLSANQKVILEAFGLSEEQLTQAVAELSESLQPTC